jgi:hypothetical protein
MAELEEYIRTQARDRFVLNWEKERGHQMNWGSELLVAVIGLVGLCFMAAGFAMVVRQGGWKQAMQPDSLGRRSLARRLMATGALLLFLDGLGFLTLDFLQHGRATTSLIVGLSFYVLLGIPILYAICRRP